MLSGRRRAAPRTSKLPVRITSYRPSDQPNTSVQRNTAHPLNASPPDRAAILAQLKSGRKHAVLQGPLSLSAILTTERLLITLPLPPSVNHQYATVNGRRLLSSAGRAYKAHVGQQLWVALSQSPARAELVHRLQSGPLALSIRFFFTSALRRDVDGGLKIAQDALCQGLGLNDNRIIETHLYKEVDKVHPRMEVSLSQAVSPASPAGKI
jgi:crossover junction endodeoxyribonuclease RusA